MLSGEVRRCTPNPGTQFWERRPSAAFAKVESGSSDADTRSTPLRRRGGQMPSAPGAVSGSTSLPTARPRPPGAPFARRTTSRQTTSAPSRATGWGRATRAHTGRQSAQTVADPMGRGLMPALPRERPVWPPEGGGQHAASAWRGGPRGLVRLPRTSRPRLRPRLPRGG